MPGIGLVMEGAVQQAPQEGRHARETAGDGMAEGWEKIRGRQYSKLSRHVVPCPALA